MTTRHCLIALGLLLALLPGPAAAQPSPIERFVGHWVGAGVTEHEVPSLGVGLIDRELSVTIQPVSAGFRLTWRSERPGDPGEIKTSTTSVLFVPAGRAGLYRADDPGDPVSGAPYSWAQVSGGVLVVQRITIAPDGKLEHQKFVRTLTARDQMQLRFTRTVDGVADRTVFSILTRR